MKQLARSILLAVFFGLAMFYIGYLEGLQESRGAPLDDALITRAMIQIAGMLLGALAMLIEILRHRLIQNERKTARS